MKILKAGYCRTPSLSRIAARKSGKAIYAAIPRGGGASKGRTYRTFPGLYSPRADGKRANLKTPVHFHSAVGIGRYFSLSSGNR